MTTIPLLPADTADRPVAWRGKMAVSREQYLADVRALAARLPESRYVLNHCDDRYLFLAGLGAALLRRQVSLFPSSRAPHVLEQLSADFPEVYCLVDRADEQVPMEIVTIDPDFTATHADSSVPAFPADQVVAVAFTSGSTGAPKPYPKTWGGFVHEARVAGRALRLSPGAAGAVVATVPPQHMYGFIASIMLPTQFGLALDAGRPFYPQDIRAALSAHHVPPFLVTTPVHIRACVLDRESFPPVDFVLSSTAPLDAALAAAAERLFHSRVMEFFGSTETGAFAVRRQAESATWKTFDDITVRMEEGGFTVETPYLPRPMILSDSVDVHNSREFVVFGRDSDLIKIGGKRASLADLNVQLLSIEGVRDGAFFMPDKVGTTEPRLTAFAVAPGKTEAEILHALLDRIDPVFMPRPLRLVSSLPRNTTGKLPRANLARLMDSLAIE